MTISERYYVNGFIEGFKEGYIETRKKIADDFHLTYDKDQLEMDVNQMLII